MGRLTTGIPPRSAGDEDGARSRGLTQSSADASLLSRLAQTILLQGRLGEATELLRRAADANPQDANARLALARALQQQGNTLAALEQIGNLTKKERSAPEAQFFEAALLGLLGRYEDQSIVYRELLRKYPFNVHLWLGLGEALKYSGDPKGAAGAFKKSVTIQPSFGEGWWALANIKTYRFRPNDVATMRRALLSDLKPSASVSLQFALGKAYEDWGRFEESFEFYASANRLHAASLPSGPSHSDRVAHFVDSAIAAFDRQDFGSISQAGHPARDPIFIIGMQRSGSTLIEQILASHPLIEGTAELDVMKDIWVELDQAALTAGKSVWDELQSLSSERLHDIGADYLERAKAFRRTDRPFFIDKRPANWMYVGLIRMALPNATIIDARRHPMACGFSNFKQHYAGGAPFSYDLEAMGHYYAEYLRLMRHFDEAQPGAVHRVLHEALIEQPDREIRGLLNRVGVQFDGACLNFHRNRRTVRSASAEQVRRPLNREGFVHWRNYEAWLAPLSEALGSAIHTWDLPVGGPR